MIEAGIALRARQPGPNLWCEKATEDFESDDGQRIIDATFADDECVMLAAKSPRLLDNAVVIFLRLLVTTFQKTKLDINWLPGKTGCMIMYCVCKTFAMTRVDCLTLCRIRTYASTWSAVTSILVPFCAEMAMMVRNRLAGASPHSRLMHLLLSTSLGIPESQWS